MPTVASKTPRQLISSFMTRPFRARPAILSVEGWRPTGLPAHSETGVPIVYLTFDDGPDPEATPALLELLDEHDAKATFFVVGRRARSHPALVREITIRGHEIGVHGWDHRRFAGMTERQFRSQIEATRDAILAVARPQLSRETDLRSVRPPFGSRDVKTEDFARAMGLKVMLWSIDPCDWALPGSEVIAERILEQVYPGAVVLSHDGGGDRRQTVSAYAAILPELRRRGYECRTVSQHRATAAV